MLKSMRSLLIGAALVGAALPAVTEAATPATPAAAVAAKPTRSGYVEVNGVRYYYEVRGEGAPLLLLHGGLGSTDMFAPVYPVLTAKRQVIAVDLYGHGRTALTDRPFTLEGMGADMDAILAKLGYGQVDVMGYSMGGGVAFQLAAQHPERVKRLVLVSAGFARDGFYPDILAQQGQVNAQAAAFMKETPMYQGYVAVAPRPQDFGKLLDTIGAYMAKPYDFSAEAKKLTTPTLLVFGDSDMYRPEHVVQFYQLLGGGLRDAGWQREHMAKNRLAILPGRTHYDIFLAPELAQTSLTFLDDTTGKADWKVAGAK